MHTKIFFLILSVLANTSMASLTEALDRVWELITKGETVDRGRLLMVYSLICPLNKVLDNFTVELDGLLILDTENIVLEGCVPCSTNITCVLNHTCCPDDPRGYIDTQQNCVDTLVGRFSSVSSPHRSNQQYFLVDSCPPNTDEVLERKCSGLDETTNFTKPLTSLVTELSYKNQYCAECFGESEDMYQFWTTFIHCEDILQASVLDGLSSNEIQDLFADLKCVNAYGAGGDFTEAGLNCKHRQEKAYVDSCNVTGSWKHFNAEINWACEHYDKPFRKFKNVFCYVCNPSVSSLLPLQNLQTGEGCNVSDGLEMFESSIQHACETLPAIPSLGRFKNVYCILCMGIKKLDYTKSENILFSMAEFEMTVSESTEYDGMDLGFLTIEMEFANFQSNIAYTFINSKFGVGYEHFYKEELNKPKKYTNGNFDQLLSAYVEACGNTSLCTDTTFDVGDAGNATLYFPYCGECSCDYTCVTNHSCCADFLLKHQPYSCVSLKELIVKIGSTSRDLMTIKYGCNTTTCTHGRSEPNFLVIDTCLPSPLVPDSEFDYIKPECDISILSQTPIPVFGTHKIPYMNQPCMQCNDLQNNVTFTFDVLCDHFIDIPLFYNVLDLVDTIVDQCIIILKPPDGSPPCSRSHGMPKCPLYLTENCQTTAQRQELADEINYCQNETDVDPVLNSSCSDESVVLSQLPPFRFGPDLFRNPYCFMCRNKPNTNTEDLISQCRSVSIYPETSIAVNCQMLQEAPSWKPYKNMFCYYCGLVRRLDYLVGSNAGVDESGTYRRLFSLSPEEWDVVTEVKEILTCPNATYDAEVEICRQIYCSERRTLKNGECVLLVDSGVDIKYHLYFGMKLLAIEETGHGEIFKTTTKLDMSYICPQLITKIQADQKLVADFVIMYCTVYSDVECPEYSGAGDWQDYTVFLPLDPTTADPSFTLYMIAHVFSTVQRTKLEQSLLRYQKIDVEITNEANGDIYRFQSFVKPEAANLRVLSKTYRIDETYPPDVKCMHQIRRANQYEPGIVLTPISICTQVELTKEEYEIDNVTMKVDVTGGADNLTKDEYSSVGGTDRIRVCTGSVFSSSPPTQPAGSTLEEIYSLYSSVLTSVSMLSLLVTFVTYCLFSPLRTVPGLVNMNLVFSMFVAEAFTEFGLWANRYRVLCIAVGMIVHYFWLATYLNLNVCSFHMFRVFVGAPLPEALSGGGRKLVQRYCLYCYGVPLLFVSSTGLGHMIKSGGSYYGYGPVTCFISEKITTIIAYIVPACILFLLNIIFFSVTFHTIRTLPDIQSNAGNKREFFLYIKLCTITGISWPLQIIDANLELSVFSFVAVFFNALQGFFIFWAYTCNLRVARMYKNLCTGTKTDDSTLSRSRTQNTRVTDISVSQSFRPGRSEISTPSISSATKPQQ